MIAKKTLPTIQVNKRSFFLSRKVNIIYILFVLLIVASFLIGILITKIQYLETRDTKNILAQPTDPGNSGANDQQANAQPATGKIKEVSDKDHIRGNKDAKITLVEYSDLECPFCKSFHPTMQDILEAYGDKVNWVYRHYPLDFHENAQKEAEASECVNELGGNDAFWSYVDKIFEKTASNGTGFALDKLGSLAAEVGVDQQQFQSCLDSNRYEKHVKDDIADGSAGGVNGTPATFVIASNGDIEMISGAQPMSVFTQVIDALLKKN